MLITMYGRGHGHLGPKFLDYVADRRYFLRTLDEFVQVCETVRINLVQKSYF